MFFKNTDDMKANLIETLFDVYIKQYFTSGEIAVLISFLQTLSFSEITHLIEQKNGIEQKDFVSLLKVMLKAIEFKI